MSFTCCSIIHVLYLSVLLITCSGVCFQCWCWLVFDHSLFKNQSFFVLVLKAKLPNQSTTKSPQLSVYHMPRFLPIISNFKIFCNFLILSMGGGISAYVYGVWHMTSIVLSTINYVSNLIIKISISYNFDFLLLLFGMY